ncbi:MAG: hypothetical protein ABR605_05610, partial [Desulfurivibrionaceae bacterium]
FIHFFTAPYAVHEQKKYDLFLNDGLVDEKILGGVPVTRNTCHAPGITGNYSWGNKPVGRINRPAHLTCPGLCPKKSTAAKNGLGRSHL